MPSAAAHARSDRAGAGQALNDGSSAGGTGLIAPFFRWLRRREVRRFHARGWAIIPDIPTDAFHAMAATLESEGWKRYGEYSGIDA